MKRLKIACLQWTLLFSITGYAQTIDQIDSLCLRMCESFQTNKHKVDTVRQREVYTKHLPVFFSKVPAAKRNEVSSNIFFRLQKQCAEYSNILDRANPPKGDWKIVDKHPAIRLTRTDCDQFVKTSKYKYLEYQGDTVDVVIDRGSWTETFADKTYSRLKFLRVNDCQFELEFVQSDNQMRMRFSKAGDKYRYRIIDKSGNYYLLSVETDGNTRIATFKLYLTEKD